jgi:endonuclease YncB( thermonuclease family)
MRKALASIGVLVALTGSAAAQGAVALAGPVVAEVVRVIDGDTVEVRARAWIDTEVTTRVRLLGVDTPEKGSRARCTAEAKLADRASAATRAALPEGAAVLLRDIRPDKYGGRVVAAIEGPDGRDLAAALLDAGLARPYDGGRKAGWCD